jgi:hypothetical protein
LFITPPQAGKCRLYHSTLPLGIWCWTTPATCCCPIWTTASRRTSPRLSAHFRAKITLGLPYFQTLLGKLPPSSYITNLLEQAALTVAGVVSVTVVGLGLTKDRKLTGSVIVVSTDTNTPIIASF